MRFNLDSLYSWIDKITKRKDRKMDYCSCVPDVWYGVDISGACKIHDEHYANKDVSKEEADIQFLENLKQIARENNNKKLLVVAYIYYFGVKYLGVIYKW